MYQVRARSPKPAAVQTTEIKDKEVTYKNGSTKNGYSNGHTNGSLVRARTVLPAGNWRRVTNPT